MYHYTITEWFFFFYLYCFLGWVFESTYVSLKSKKFVNRGFMRGPFLPIYGSGAIMMLVVSSPWQDNLVLTFLSGCVGATILELITGIVMESLFKVRYWDYSNQKFNYKGYICLSSTIAWGFLTILMTEFLQKGVEKCVFAIPDKVITWATLILSVYLIVDFTLSFKAAMDLREVLMGLKKAKEEMERIEKRLDVLIAVAADEIETRRQEEMLRLDELAEKIERKFETARERRQANRSEFVEEVREELAELRSKYSVERERGERLRKLKDVYQRSMIKGNPGMISAKFGEALEELKRNYKK